MATEKQLVANRANALKSTGPRTEEGKARSRHNALTHGLTATQVVIPGETPADYSALRDRLMSEIAPQSALEEDLADRLATTLWRLRRIPVLENALFAWLQHYRFRCETDLGWLLDDYVAPPGEEDKAGDHYTAQIWPGRKADECRTLKLIGRTVEDAFSDHNTLSKLSSYEARLLRQAERLLAQLDKRRENRTEIQPVDIDEPPVIASADAPLVIDPDALSSFTMTS